MLHLRQGVVAGYHDNSLHHFIGTNGNLGRFNRFEYGVLTPLITKNNSDFGNLDGTQLSSPAQRNDTHFGESSYSCEIEFSTSHLEDDSDISSPPLWKTSPPTTPTIKAPPTLRSQAMARGRYELMEMIENVPESAYELSLKDLTELPTTAMENRGSMSEPIPEKKMKINKRRNNKKHHSRNRSMDNREFLLKMFFPAAMGPTKKSSSNGTRSKVPQNPQQMKGEMTGLEKSVDAEWWKKRFSSTRESVNGRTSCSSSSNDSSRRNMGGFLPGCWSFIHTNKSKATGHTGCFF